ncbi:MAG: hypothetical protein EAX96_19210 [Candidatus Lokiarchaeota archaeon]|nr:hypothetical protein [Candidatus Lokiarchaeota archaeon]
MKKSRIRENTIKIFKIFNFFSEFIRIINNSTCLKKFLKLDERRMNRKISLEKILNREKNSNLEKN